MTWDREDLGPQERARALLEQAGSLSRGGLKRLAAQVETLADPALIQALIAEGRRRGGELPDAAVGWPAKRLLRVARGRQEQARRRTNPVMRDEAFTCAHCHHPVPPMGRTARDHCPRCLRSLHVDVVPGDRAARCGGVLDPVGAELRHGELVIRYRCRLCGEERLNRALLDGVEADDWALLSALSAGEEV